MIRTSFYKIPIAANRGSSRKPRKPSAIITGYSPVTALTKVAKKARMEAEKYAYDQPSSVEDLG